MKNVIIICFLMSTHSLFGQGTAPDFSVEKGKAMKKLSFMIGQWEGKGWFKDRNGEMHEFLQYETITSQLNGLVLEIHGVGLDMKTADTVHHAFAVFSYDNFRKEYRMESHLANGNSTIARAWFENGIFFWGFSPRPGMNIRYEISNPDPVTWNEIGKYQIGDGPWIQNYSSSITKK